VLSHIINFEDYFYLSHPASDRICRNFFGHPWLAPVGKTRPVSLVKCLRGADEEQLFSESVMLLPESILLLLKLKSYKLVK
jgi:hypothetical protein